MLVGTDNSHFRKYLTTLGISVIAGSLSLAGLFYNLQGDLMVKQEDLDKLTPTARATIQQRQSYLEIAAAFAPYVLLGLVVVGGAIAAVGLRGWATRQRTIDGREDLELKKLDFEFRKLSDEQRASALEEEVQQETASESAATVDVRPLPQRSSDARAAILEAEALVIAKLRTYFGDRRLLTQIGLSTSSTSTAMQLDAVVRPEGDQPGIVLEIKYTSTVQNLRNRIVDASVRAAEAASALTSAQGKVFLPAAVIVHSGIVHAERRAREVRHTLLETFRQPIAILVVSIDELEHLEPADLARKLYAAGLGDS